jgi:ribonucleoside-diphosphate reductase alpha chain
MDWIKPGHINADNTHNVSATISVDKSRLYYKHDDKSFKLEFPEIKQGEEGFNFDEWEAVGEWMWGNKEFYNGLSVLPFDGGTYSQAPFQNITKEEYEELLNGLSNVDLSQIIEEDDIINFNDSVACGGGNCEII